MSIGHSECSNSHVHDAESSKSGESVGSEQSNNEVFILVPYNMLTDKKPRLGLLFDSLDIGIQFYKNYGQEIGFDVKLSSQKRYNDGTVRLRWATCSRAGFTESFKSESINETQEIKRRTVSKKKGCPAVIRFKNLRCSSKFYIYVFVEEHNHELVSEENLHLLRVNRKVDFVDELFIHKAGTSNIGASRAHGLLSNIKGGYDVRGGIAIDFKNVQRDINSIIGDKDSQTVINIMENRKKYVSNFSFEFRSEDDHLTGLFWADDTSKCNYKEFGDILSFDATYSTNKYLMVFVPFTGIDNHNRCVTFGAGLLANEKADSYVWLLQQFLKAFGKQPMMVVTDQDSSMKKAVNLVFPQSKHRLCMWHITQKLNEKIPSHISEVAIFKKTFHDIVWNNQSHPEEFESKWLSMIDEYDLKDDSWFKSMFSIRKSWIPAYFRDFELSGLMRTTSRSESENYAFSHYLHHKSNLVKFIISFDSAMEKQRHHQSLLDYQSATTSPKLRSPLPIERHASEVYTRNFFLIIQKELYNSVFFCVQESVVIEDESEVYVLKDKKKMKKDNDKKGNEDEDSDSVYRNSLPDLCPNTRYKVVFNTRDDTINCSCMLFVQEGVLCRHMFFILNMKEFNEIPSKYILRRFEKDIIGHGVLKKKYPYSHNGGKIGSLIQDAYDILRLSINKIANNEDELTKLISQLQVMNICIPLCTPSKQLSRRAVHIENILGAPVPDVIKVHNPVEIRNKGWASGKRIKSNREKAIEASKKGSRLCSICHKPYHNSRSCILREQN